MLNHYDVIILQRFKNITFVGGLGTGNEPKFLGLSSWLYHHSKNWRKKALIEIPVVNTDANFPNELMQKLTKILQNNYILEFDYKTKFST